MTFSNVKAILSREIRDQLRDRRTLFMMFVLPLLLYPLLGMSINQLAQFRREKPVEILVIGARKLANVQPPLFENQRFSATLFGDPKSAELLELHFVSEEPRQDDRSPRDLRAEAWQGVHAGQYDAAIYFPQEFVDRLERVGRHSRGEDARVTLPEAEIIYTTATEKSQIARDRLNDVFNRWLEKVGETNLAALKVPVSTVRPFLVEKSDVADQTAYRGASNWSKILPMLLLIWAMTGAFYPAVDLCAGEKERGTLETLLSSPAERSEIVLGKLLTIMLFSMITAALNLVSVGATGWMVFSSYPGFGLPSPLSIVWLALALVPVSALFSALCLALAAFARSSKEGQYYLMPLLMVTLPLAILPMTPGVELNLGSSLIPVTGIVLLLRTALQGSYWEALQFLPVVLAVTLVGCWFSIRWAVDQFNSESVLFRESERLDMGLWLRHLLRDRQPTPTVAAAVLCGVLILMIRFFLGVAMQRPGVSPGFVQSALVTQLVVILLPAMLMTAMFTNSARQTLSLRRPPWLTLPAAALLAFLLHPVVNTLQVIVTQLYPVDEQVRSAMKAFTREMPNLTVLVLVIGLVPAVCEELAFRGFVLSGFRHLGRKWRAITYTAIFFGLAHAVLQQSLIACVVGVVIGYVAVQSGSILPCMVFHAVHNTLMLLTTQISPQLLDRWPTLGQLGTVLDDGGIVYSTPWVIACGAVALLVLFWFGRLPYPKSPEEELQEAIDHGRDVDTDADDD